MFKNDAVAFSHVFLNRLANRACEIQRHNESARDIIFSKGDEGQDVVTESDLENEKMLRKMLVEEIPDIAFIYGEENGYEAVSDGDFGALIDPIDGTRAYAAGFFYSGISVAFVNPEGKTIAGFIVLINNQSSKDYSVWTFDGNSAQKNGELFNLLPDNKKIEESCISVTNVASFGDEDRAMASRIFKLIADRARGPFSLCSGAAEAIAVIEGMFQGFINISRQDYVSHPVAIEIAKCLGLYVRHVFNKNSDFAIEIDRREKSIRARGDMTLVITLMSIKEDVDRILEDAAKIS